jgi:chloride channel 7
MNYSSTHSSNGATHLLLLAAESTAYKSKVCESLDYDLFESQVRLRYQKKTSQLPHHVSTIDEAKRWMLTTLVATSTALIAVFITWCTRTLLELKYDTAQHFLSPSSEQNNESFNHFLAWCILTTINLTFVGIASLVVVYIAPIASGSGIPEIKCLLNGIKIPHVVRVKTLFAKVAGVIFSVSGGLPIGKEGPMIHSGAIVGAGLSQGKSTTCGYDTGFSKLSMFRNDREKSDFITCGTAAGVAAAFGAPIGGVLFCLEEGTSWWNPSLTWRTFFSAMVATLFVDLFLSQVNQTVDFGYFSQPGMLSFGSFIESDLISPYNMIELLPFSLIGILGGVFGAGFNALNTKITKLRLKLKRNGKRSG